MANYDNQKALNSTINNRNYNQTKTDVKSPCDGNCKSCSNKSCVFANSEIVTISSLKDKMDQKRLSDIVNYSFNGPEQLFKNFNYNNKSQYGSKLNYSGSKQGYLSSAASYSNPFAQYNQSSGKSSSLSYEGNSFNTTGLGYSGGKSEGSYPLKSGCSGCSNYSLSKSSSKSKGKY